MTILTIKQRFNQSTKGREVLKELKNQHQKSGTRFNWSSNRPNLCLKTDLISISSLHIDTDTQRDPFDSARVQKLRRIISKPCSRHFKRVIVSNRTWNKGSAQYVVVEGQGRTLSAYAMGETSVPYDLYTFSSKVEEAEFFLSQGKDIHTIKDWEKHSVILSLPQNKWHTQSQDVQKVVSSTTLEYEPQLINDVDCSRAYSGIRDSIVRSEPKIKAGQRSCNVTVEVANLMVKYGKQKGQILVLRSDLFYPMTEFVLSYKKVSKGLEKLEDKIKSLVNTNGGQATLDDMANACSLNICKNQNDKRDRYKNIRQW